MHKKINTKDLVEKIEKLSRTKMATQEIVPLAQFRELKKKLDPRVVLVVEDDESMRAALKKTLESSGHVVKMASDATQLSAVIDDNPIDLIILDIGLPWVDGFELGQLLKEHKDLKKIPLIYVSGQATEEDKKRAFEIGADDFIKKPFELETFKKSIEYLLKLKEAQ
jgi:two-component system aerobic respiration control protein ArcA